MDELASNQRVCRRCGVNFSGIRCAACHKAGSILSRARKKAFRDANKPPAADREVTQELIMKLFNYDPVTGVFTRKVSTNRSALVGSEVCNMNTNGYLRVRIYRKEYKLHRLAWLYVHGRWPLQWIDHINGDPRDNRIANLRECTPSQNGANKKVRCNSMSGLKGVSWNATQGKWFAAIQKDGKSKTIGFFDRAIDAHEAYCVAAKQVHKEFARFN